MRKLSYNERKEIINKAIVKKEKELDLLKLWSKVADNFKHLDIDWWVYWYKYSYHRKIKHPMQIILDLYIFSLEQQIKKGEVKK